MSRKLHATLMQIKYHILKWPRLWTVNGSGIIENKVKADYYCTCRAAEARLFISTSIKSKTDDGKILHNHCS